MASLGTSVRDSPAGPGHGEGTARPERPPEAARPPDAELLFKQARRRERRRRAGFVAAIALVVAALALGTLLLVGTGAARTGAHPSATSTGTPSTRHQALQFRPSEQAVLHPNGRRCPSTSAAVPAADRSAWVAWLGGCAHVGPSILTIRDVESVTAGYSCSGNVFVHVRLRPADVGRFDRMVHRVGDRVIGVVILGRQLSIYTGDLGHTRGALAGSVQIAGGLARSSRLPHRIARALGHTLEWAPTRHAPGPITYC